MSKTQRAVDLAIDEFVERVNRSPRETLDPEVVPEALRVGQPDEFAAFWDEHLSAPLLAAGFVQFGRPSTGSYDPVCFDLNSRTNAGECPVVHLDHEAALMGGKVQVVAELAPSFPALVGA